MLKADEILDDLQLNGLSIIRRKGAFAYGSDAVALANFAVAVKTDLVLDIGTGTGILAILIHAKTGARVVAVDIDPALCDMARRSVLHNGLAHDIDVLHADARTLHDTLGYERFSCVVCNPPYFSGGTMSENGSFRSSTHDETLSMDELALASSRMLKNGGKLFMVYPAARFATCCAKLIGYGIMPKRVKPVFSKDNTPRVMLIEAKKGGHDGLIWEV